MKMVRIAILPTIIIKKWGLCKNNPLFIWIYQLFFLPLYQLNKTIKNYETYKQRQKVFAFNRLYRE
jgi:hypothetical protein